MPAVLLPVDGSDDSLDAVGYVIEWAASLAAGTPLEVVLAHVQAPASLYELVITRDPDAIAAASREAGEHLVAPAMAALIAQGINVSVEYGVGDVAHTLVDIVEETGCDMVVMGTQECGHPLGAILLEVLRTCPVPVMVIKHAAPLPQESLELPDASDSPE